MSIVTSERNGEVLILRADNPPVNALSHAVRLGLHEAIAAAQDDTHIAAIVIACAGRTFFAGADITEFGGAQQAPGLPDLVDFIEASGKPVVAAMHGTALGGGLEVALACHYRIAAQSAKMGLPEVKLGILPGAGGTQRLPRVIGAAEALTMIVFGDPIVAAKAHALGLVDRVAQDDALVADAVAFAREVARNPTHPVASRRSDKLEAARADISLFARFAAEHARRLRGLEAPAACIEAVKAAIALPYAEGARTERALFAKLVAGSQSKALRHVFFAERAAGKIDGLSSDAPVLPVKKVGVLGAGTMGGGISMNFLSAGIPVTIVERERSALDRGIAIMRKNYEASAKKGRLSADQVERAMGLLTPTLEMEALADCDLVVEAVFEDMGLKRQVFRRLDAIAKPGAILASNTSYLNIDDMATETARPDHVIGLHFFSPANVMRLLEVVRGAKTAPHVLKTCMELGRKIGKVAVVSGVCHGFIGNRMLSRRQEQAQALLLEGAKPWDVDRVLVAFGFPMGPFQMSDLAGLDIGWNAATSKSGTIREVLCERGRRGQKTGKGFYDYNENRTPSPSPETEEIIAAFARQTGAPPRAFSDQEILERLLYPVVSEGAKILDEKIAQRASDIDVVWINGYGWPAYTGGPMFWAESVGLRAVVAGLDQHGLDASPLLRARAKAGGGFG